jgi:hypothetical protein
MIVLSKSKNAAVPATLARIASGADNRFPADTVHTFGSLSTNFAVAGVRWPACGGLPA